MESVSPAHPWWSTPLAISAPLTLALCKAPLGLKVLLDRKARKVIQARKVLQDQLVLKVHMAILEQQARKALLDQSPLRQ
jgi:hypothetical protein